MPLIIYTPLSSYDFSYTAPVPLAWNPTVYSLIAAFSALPMWMTLDLTFQILTTFKRYQGLYFYSLLFCTWCTTVRQIGRVCIYFVPGCNKVFSLVFAMLGWVGTVTGFAVVLYSRLHLVTQNRKILRGVLGMIVLDVLLFHLTTMVAQIGVVTKIHPNWVSWYPAVEKVQIAGFTVQETIISSIYIWATHKMIRERYSTEHKRSIRLLILVQVICILIDIPFIGLAFSNFFLIKATLTSFAYAIKLKLEFIVLNDLVGIVKRGIAPRGINEHGADDEQTAASPCTERPSITSLGTEKRRFSLTLLWRHGSTVPTTPTSAKAPDIAFTEKIVFGEGNNLAPVRKNDASKSTLTNSSSTTCSKEDKIEPEFEDDDGGLDDIEKQYLGRFGQNLKGRGFV